MNRFEYGLFFILFLAFGGWCWINYTNVEQELENVQSTLKPSEHFTFPPQSKSLLSRLEMDKNLKQITDNRLWGIIPQQSLSAPKPSEIIYTPPIGGRSARLCKNELCYEFIGISANEALFIDVSLNAEKKLLRIKKGGTILGSLRMINITSKSVYLVNVKNHTTYEISMFNMDMSLYKPKTESPKGK